MGLEVAKLGERAGERIAEHGVVAEDPDELGVFWRGHADCFDRAAVRPRS